MNEDDKAHIHHDYFGPIEAEIRVERTADVAVLNKALSASVKIDVDNNAYVVRSHVHMLTHLISEVAKDLFPNDLVVLQRAKFLGGDFTLIARGSDVVFTRKPTAHGGRCPCCERDVKQILVINQGDFAYDSSECEGLGEEVTCPWSNLLLELGLEWKPGNERFPQGGIKLDRNYIDADFVGRFRNLRQIDRDVADKLSRAVILPCDDPRKKGVVAILRTDEDGALYYFDESLFEIESANETLCKALDQAMFNLRA